MQRSRRNDDQSDDVSVGGTSLAATTRRPQRQRTSRGSFASATASSLAGGGPGTKAPPARIASASAGAGATAPPKPCPGGGGGEKENAENRRGDPGGDGGRGTPPEAPGGDGGGDPSTALPVLSPTPYWKVCRERGNRTSPRTTRSAAKKERQRTGATAAVLARGMRELDELEDDSGGSDGSEDDGGVDLRLDPTALRFSPPDGGLRAARDKNARRRREADAERERVRRQKVRKAGAMTIVDNAGPSKQPKRVPKRPKRGHDKNPKGGDQPALPLAIAAAGPSTEEMRLIMQQSLVEHNSRRIEELVAESAAAGRDADHYKRRHEELEERYNLLEEQARSREGNKNELQVRCVEQRGTMNGYEKEIGRLEHEKNDLEERRSKDSQVRDAERQRMEDELTVMKEEHSMELQKVMAETASIKEGCNLSEEKYNTIQTELESTQSKLAKSTEGNEEVKRLRARDDESRKKLHDHVAELQRREAELTSQSTTANATNESNKDTIASLQSEITNHLVTISSNAQLQSDLQTTKNDLEGAKRKIEGMHSPRSRDALEQGFTEEVGELEDKLSTMEGENMELQNQLSKKATENQALKKDLDEVQVQNGELCSKLNEANVHLEEVASTADTTKSENTHLSQQVKTANAKYEENERQLEEIAVEYEQVLTKLKLTEGELQQQIREVGSEAQEREATLETKCTAVAAEKDSLGRDLRHAENTISELRARVNNLEGESANSQQLNSVLQSEKRASDRKLTELSGQLQTLTNHLESAQAAISVLEAKLRAKDEYCEQFAAIERRLLREKYVLNEIRRDLHNRVIQLSGNIRVFVRVRPMIDSERQLQVHPQHDNSRRPPTSRPSPGRPSSRGSLHPASGSGRPSSRGSMMASSSHRSLHSTEVTVECPFHFPSITDRNISPASAKSSSPSPNHASFNDLTKQTIELTEPYKDRGGLNPRRKKWKFGFDRVFHQDNGQDDVWEGAAPLVQSCVDGYHVCMFAYGQTGSGKTHTMIGDSQNRGLIPRAVEKIFAAKQEIEQSRCGDVSVDIVVELLEVYNEEVRDLLDDNAGPEGQLIKLKLSSNEAVGNVKVNARDKEEVAGILQLAQERRCVKATKSNAESSRSHLLFTIHFDVSSSKSSPHGDVATASKSGCLHIVDLAGSERLDKSGSHGALLTETKHINTSLSALALVIEKLQAKKSPNEHIPYRDSKLTYLLRNSLGGDSKTLAIICCSPHQAHFNESLNSIRFAAKASKVELKEGNKVDV